MPATRLERDAHAPRLQCGVGAAQREDLVVGMMQAVVEDHGVELLDERKMLEVADSHVVQDGAVPLRVQLLQLDHLGAMSVAVTR